MAKKAYIGVDGVARKVKKGYVGVHQVPQAEYAVLAYIQSTGTQYVDTGYLPNPATSMEAELLMTGTFSPSDNNGSPFGVQNSSIGYSMNFGGSAEGKYTLYPWLNKTYGNGGSVTPFTVTDSIIRTRNRLTVRNGSITWGTVTASCDEKTTTNTTSLMLFAARINGTAYPFNSYGMRVFSWKIFENGVLARDFIPVKRNADNAAGLYDRVNDKFYANAGTGAFIAGAETGAYIYDIPQEGNFARRIKKAYIGIGGVARPCWASGFSDYGEITPLSLARTPTSAYNQGYALFGGGQSSPTNYKVMSDVVNAYDDSLTMTTPTDLSKARSAGGGSSVGVYAIFAGGASGDYGVNTVDAYNASLTRSTPTALSYTPISLGSARTANYALFGGGRYSGAGTRYSTVDAYNASLTRSSPTALSVAKAQVTGGYNGVYALFGGGKTYSNSTETTNIKVDAYNESLTKSTAPDLSSAREVEAVSVGPYVLFAGSGIVEAYDQSLTRTLAAELSSSDGTSKGSFRDGKYAVFCMNYGTCLDVYDENLTKEVYATSYTNNGGMTSGSVGNYLLFGGGWTSGGLSATVHAFVN